MADHIKLNSSNELGETIATDLISDAHYQRVKINFGEDGSATDVSLTDPLPTKTLSQTGGNSTITKFDVSISSITLIEPNLNRKNFIIFNGSLTSNLYVSFSSTNNIDSFSIVLYPEDTFSPDFYVYNGIVKGFWGSVDNSGFAMVTEFA